MKDALLGPGLPCICQLNNNIQEGRGERKKERKQVECRRQRVPAKCKAGITQKDVCMSSKDARIDKQFVHSGSSTVSPKGYTRYLVYIWSADNGNGEMIPNGGSITQAGRKISSALYAFQFPAGHRKHKRRGHVPGVLATKHT